jgi:hypothetical protein
MHTLGKNVCKEMLLKLNKYTWIHRADQIRTEAAEMQFLRWVVGYTLLDQR